MDNTFVSGLKKPENNIRLQRVDVCLTIVGCLTDARQVLCKPEYESLNMAITLCNTENCQNVIFGAICPYGNRNDSVSPSAYCTGNLLVLLSNSNKANHDSEEIGYVER